MAMQTVSARIPGEDLAWLASYDIQGATTPSDKLRALVSQIRRQHEGSLEYSASLQWMRDLASPFVTAMGAFEHRNGTHSEVVRLVSDWAPQIMAVLVSETALGREPQRKAQEVEEKLLQRCTQLLAAILRLGVTSNSDCYDPQILQRFLPPLLELSGVIATSRKEANEENRNG